MFRDFLQFLTYFLDYLVKSLSKIERQNFYFLYNTMQNFYPDALDKIVQLVKQKGVFCYDYIDKFGRLDETAISTQEQCYNRLAGQYCFEADNARVQQV